MNINLSLKLHVVAKSNRWLGLNIRLFNDGDIDYFIDADSFRSSRFPNLDVLGPSGIRCIDHLSPTDDESDDFIEMWKLPSWGYIELSADYPLSGACYFKKALPGIYKISSTAGLFLYENEDSKSFIDYVRVTGDTSFELE